MSNPPDTPAGNDVVRVCGDMELPDPYKWLRASNWQEALRDPGCLDDAIRRHLEAENGYLESELAPVAALREHLKGELRARIPEREASVPFADGAYAYYTRYEEGQQHRLYCRQRREDGSGAGEEILLDGNAEAEGEDFFRVAGSEHSPDHRYFAYAVDLTGSEYHRLRVRDLERAETVDTGVDDLSGDIAWANDGRTLFYTTLDANHRASRVYRLTLGESRPELVYEEHDPGFYLGVDITESRRFIVIHAADHADTAEVRVVEADAPKSAPILLAPRRTGLDYEVGEHGGQFYILTNADGALDYKIVTAPVESPAPENWRELVPHRPGVLIRRLLLFRNHMVRLETAEALPRIVVRDLASGDEHTIAPDSDDEAYSFAIHRGYEFDTATLRLTYASPRLPQRTYDYDMVARSRTLRKEQQVPSGHKPEDYVVRRLNIPSHDGVGVPVTVLHRRDAPPEAGRPLVLYGYGAYGITIPTAFTPDRFTLVDRGITYAVAHVRGGTERGHGWYLDGKLDRKTNTFHDFIAVAEGLVDAGYASAGNIVANGRSAGGMLMGVVTNWRPELFRAVVAEVPFVDVLNTMCDAELPLTPPEWPEWGNPLEDVEACRRIASYSPCDNVAPRAYPHVLATAGIADPRVTYWEPAKWVARLRANNTGARRILLHTNMTAGHAGAAGRFARLDEVALVDAFILMVCGLADETV
ncbi:S9 family peptidase [Ferruginivarius sediminum]|uniref:S9 family peptidase n=1 Tax=Ferruginivarius sediminum TaxID=2661937 RepID=A0A369TAW0_9PROT|nr:S9 family peptidase [Ferruginivarius sediminum]RDD62012.1 S9 family peptidase [Ferruginivarius sediminum]